ncbi:EAL domain-containing protein [Bacillaceae bacterium W0354]
MLLEDLIDNENFEHHFQPVFNLSSYDKIGYEALLRTELFKNPEVAFNKAKEANRLFELDRKSIKKAIITSNEIETTKNNKLFLNVYPSNLMEPTFLNFIEELKMLIPNHLSIVFEINENEIIQNFELLKQRIIELKKRGYLFALDDVGKGSASLLSIIELEPDCIKMDKYFSQKLATSIHKQELLKSFVTYCDSTHSKLILEGIEEEDDMQAALSLGVKYGQGYLLGKPSPILI